MRKKFRPVSMLLSAFLMAGLVAGSQAAWAAATAAIAQGSFAPVAQETAATVGGSAPSTQAPAPAGGTTADPTANAPRTAYYDTPKLFKGERISLDFQNADIHNIIRIIGEVSGKNIVVSDAVSGKVTLKLKDVPWDQALDIVLSSHGLGVEESGNVLTIYDLPTLTQKMIERERAAAEREARIAQAPLMKKVFTPKYAPVSNVSGELNKLKSVRGKISAIGNDIYVEDDPSTIATMTQVFMRVDKVAKQILIEARIIEASSTFVENLGISWGADYRSDNALGTDYKPGSSFGQADIGSGAAAIDFSFLNKANSLLLNAKINASETSAEARTISAPRIMAANDQEVSIKQGQQIPYKSGSSATTAANVQFKEVVMELKVKPHIEENGQIITLEIELTNDTADQSGGAGEEPAINTREAETILMVKDGETVVIGGIIVDSMSTGISRVPGVHRIPILGWLFQDRSINNVKSEMLIFITANIIPINL